MERYLGRSSSPRWLRWLRFEGESTSGTNTSDNTPDFRAALCVVANGLFSVGSLVEQVFEKFLGFCIGCHGSLGVSSSRLSCERDTR